MWYTQNTTFKKVQNRTKESGNMSGTPALKVGLAEGLMKHRIGQVFAIFIVLLLTACTNGNDTGQRLVPLTPSSGSTPTPVRQLALPKKLLDPKYPVMDWVFNQTCSRAATSYDSSQMNATIAYDSAAWLYPNDGHLVQGFQDCEKDALLLQARNQGILTLLTVGVDSSWSEQDLAQYIDQASSQVQVPCTTQTTTYICNIVNWTVAGGYAGVIIDFEAVKWNYPDIRTKFGRFMQELQSALHQKGLLCGLTLLPKVGDTPSADIAYYYNNFQDWHLLSNIDFLVDMTLDLDLTLNRPGPITSIPWLEQQLDYLWHTIPQALSKTIWELPLYGREWRKDTSSTWHIVGDESCQQVNAQKASQPLLSDVNTDPTTPELAWNDADGNRHELWYSTPTSLLAMMTQLQQKVRDLLDNAHYKLPISFWYRGAECDNFFGTAGALATFYQS